MAWFTVANVGEITEGSINTFEVEGKRLAISKIEDEFFIIEDVCTHDNGPLGSGELDGDLVECPRHGARFNVKTGEVANLPAIVPIQTFPVKVEGDNLLVDLS